jgi:topoisomerase (DNA) II binding protein 1
VIRAGDGTILATSPPYTRSFKSNVNFAVVSAGMPSVDPWVQEFMRHNIPCISADYLVEYVCKPGYSLSKHVLFNMHDLADKALEKVLKNQHDGEAAESDIACSTCGSNDRGRPMLVCGSCGVQVRVDCCEPPVEGAGDWLCPKCEEPKPAAKKAKKPAKSRVLKSR